MSLHVFYGGTFDPVHNGHLAIARHARDVLASRIQLMPSADPPHRAPPGATALQRAEMLELAIRDEPGLCVDRRELMREGRSYSVDTVRAFRAGLGEAAGLPQASVVLVVGADSFLGFTAWHDWRALLDITHLLVAERPGSRLDADLPRELASAMHGRWADSLSDLAAVPAGRVLRLRQPLHDESATDIRRRIAAGEPWRALVPPAVAAYIEAQGLYVNGPALPARL